MAAFSGVHFSGTFGNVLRTAGAFGTGVAGQRDEPTWLWAIR